jgi:hypothetical protein
MSDTLKDRFAANLEHAKATGSNRASSIKKIIKDAALQTFAELKEGSSELSETAKDTLSSTANEWKSRTNTQSSASEDSERYPKTKPIAALSSLVQTIKNQSSREQLKEKLANLDSNLASRYGQRYEEISQKRRDVLDWYNKTLLTSEAEGTNFIQDRQDSLNRKSANVGASVARTEQKIKQYLRTILKSSGTKS